MTKQTKPSRNRKKEHIAKNANAERILNNEIKRKMDQCRVFSYSDWGPAES